MSGTTTYGVYVAVLVYVDGAVRLLGLWRAR
jgi:hypothetical protein